MLPQVVNGLTCILLPNALHAQAYAHFFLLVLKCYIYAIALTTVRKFVSTYVEDGLNMRLCNVAACMNSKYSTWEDQQRIQKRCILDHNLFAWFLNVTL